MGGAPAALLEHHPPAAPLEHHQPAVPVAAAAAGGPGVGEMAAGGLAEGLAQERGCASNGKRQS